MAQYFNVNGKVHELPDCINPSDYIRGAFTPITKVEADALRASPPPTAQEQRDAIQAQIDTLERQQLMPRLSRDIYIAMMLKEAATAGLTEPQLYAANIGYQRLKDFDAQITALRNQMDAIV